MQAYLKRIAGYCLTGSIAEQKFFFIYGGGGNGKGVFLNTLMWILDSYGRQSNMDTFTEAKFTKHASEIAFFQGARLVVASETNVGQRWNEARIKAMTGGDKITANFMRADPFSFLPTFKLLFSGNHKPHLRNVDIAIKRRLFLLPFDYDVPADKIDETLTERLQAEAGGILAWAIDGCMEWQQTRLKPPSRVIATTAEYFESEDKIGAFLDDCCELSTGTYISTTRLFERYVKWSDGQGTYSGGRPGFLDMLAVKGFKSEKYGGEQVIRGVKIAYDPDQAKAW
jgi:putative DNA primase/helicase